MDGVKGWSIRMKDGQDVIAFLSAVKGWKKTKFQKYLQTQKIICLRKKSDLLPTKEAQKNYDPYFFVVVPPGSIRSSTEYFMFTETSVIKTSSKSCKPHAPCCSNYWVDRRTFYVSIRSHKKDCFVNSGNQ